ncbi:MAG TPA: sterol desaturase family protein [Methylomirabilota bacterium]|nr:sterol desaturase family protein [Methylomirabilota bacterium]
MTIPLVVAAVALGMIVWERAAPGRPWPRVAGWWARALSLNALQAAMVFVAGAAWDGWMLRHRPWSADGLGVPAGALLGYLVVTFVYYWWHRWRHEVGWLWRWLHQVHHSPQRIEVITSFYKHPLELLANGVLSSAIVYLVVGLGPAAASTAVLLTGLAELFYHWNVRTPPWLGYLIQRPESHCVHHQEGLHAFNYADLPLWDMLFGTFRNPGAWRGRCGFGPAGEPRLLAMLRGVDVVAAEARGARP